MKNVTRKHDNQGVLVTFHSEKAAKLGTNNKKTCSTGIIDIHGKCIEKIKGIPNALLPLAAEARKYKDPKEFAETVSIDILHGRYWHITKDPNFKIDKKQVPRDMSTMPCLPDTPGLMVSCDPELWAEHYGEGRQFIAEIDLAHAIPNEDFTAINRGFGHEVLISNLNAVSVKQVLPLKEGLKEEKKYQQQLEKMLNSEEDAIDFWRKANA